MHDCTVGDLLSNSDHWAEALEAMREAYACGQASGIAFSFDDPEAYVTQFAEMVRNASPSMRLDHVALRPSEIDFINGAIPPIGRAFGIATPVNDRLSETVRAREANFGGAPS